ncbi:hypothetical protein EJ08DRAFT_51679 [Tothia fuscella]|uniref:Uncharacterized protein n=1 Tax=Tothia fuscella TaxID=1048955 RepID=A0A9P4NFI8_9PEZI|nr:hypothetical protein EJ08DRAFT_51679 [Tothia fuscella]
MLLRLSPLFFLSTRCFPSGSSDPKGVHFDVRFPSHVPWFCFPTIYDANLFVAPAFGINFCASSFPGLLFVFMTKIRCSNISASPSDLFFSYNNTPLHTNFYNHILQTR